ncbi:MAG: hypothetical protein LIQ26_05055 [Bacteroidota bacterium]|nr:hypothetical protein [Bacteroidota bacterium]
MKKTLHWAAWLMIPALLSAGCEKLDDKIEDFPDYDDQREPASVSLNELAELFAEVPFGTQQMEEVYQAVLASADNGYDEEYTLRNLFVAPGTGVGEDKLETKSPVKSYSTPMRDLLAQTVRERAARTKVGGGEPMDADAYLQALQDSDAQIYWPYFENWEGDVLPVITFDPGDNSSNNVGYRLVGEGADRHIEKVNVTEEMAMETPVWVINRNDDAAYTTLQVLRKNDPDWGQGGSVTVQSKADTGERSLFMKDFKMIRNFDCWFAGASEFFIKAGKLEDFRASTEAELKLYNPAITDFMLVCRRRWRGQTIHVNTVLVSQWTDQLDKIALMIIEDDGGSMTSWKCSAVVKVNSKSYGFELDLPFRRYDDIVWRGQLSNYYLTKYNNQMSRFGDVAISFGFE